MKRIFVMVSAALLMAGVAQAQDFEKATNLAKGANEALVNGDAQVAIDGFKAALAEASGCTADGAAELVATCTKGIVSAEWALCNNLAKEGKTPEAIEQAKVVIAAAAENGEEEIKAKAEELKTQLHQAYANTKIKAASVEKDAATKVALYKEAIANLDEVIAAEPTNSKAYLSKGQVENAIGQKDLAIECYTKAKELGAEDAANKQLSNIYVKDASAKLSKQQYSAAVDSAVKSLEYLPSANAYKIAGIASQKAGNIAASVEYLEKYLEIKPNDEQIKAAVTALKANLKK